MKRAAIFLAISSLLGCQTSGPISAEKTNHLSISQFAKECQTAKQNYEAGHNELFQRSLCTAFIYGYFFQHVTFEKPSDKGIPPLDSAHTGVACFPSNNINFSQPPYAVINRFMDWYGSGQTKTNIGDIEQFDEWPGYLVMAMFLENQYRCEAKNGR